MLTAESHRPLTRDPELAESRVRRLMKQRADLAEGWQHRKERRELLSRIDAAIDLYHEAVRNTR